jgi:myo-inositol-1(or 4)-monophosphatase
MSWVLVRKDFCMTSQNRTFNLNLNAVLDVAISAAQAAGSLMLSERHSTKRINTKSSDVDLVTHVDLACDELIRAHIQRAFPEHSLLTEETYKQGDTETLDWHEPVWIVDPIDGTTNYAHGFPHSAVSIACCVEKEPVVGVIYDPFKQELFHAIHGNGAFLNDAPIRVSETAELNKALLATGFAFRRETLSEEYSRALLEELLALLNACRDVRRAGSAALDLAYVAAGRLDGFYEYYLAPWDVAAGVLLVQEAGGVVLSSSGQNLDLSTATEHIVSATPGVFDDFQRFLTLTRRSQNVSL